MLDIHSVISDAVIKSRVFRFFSLWCVYVTAVVYTIFKGIQLSLSSGLSLLFFRYA